MNKTPLLGYLGVDQYGSSYRLTGSKFPRKQLLEYLGASSAQKMYIDTRDGAPNHIGYIVCGLWITLYKIIEWGK